MLLLLLPRETVLDLFHKWSILLSFSMATFNDIMLAVGMCHILYLGTTVFAE